MRNLLQLVASRARNPYSSVFPELRNSIYQFVFSSKAVKVYPKWDDPRYDHSYIVPRGPTALLYTCRQIRIEAQGLLFSSSTFDLRGCGALRFVKDVGTDRTTLVTSIICNVRDLSNLRRGVESQAYKSLQAVQVAGFNALSSRKQVDMLGLLKDINVQQGRRTDYVQLTLKAVFGATWLQTLDALHH